MTKRGVEYPNVYASNKTAPSDAFCAVAT
jgi:hypothetical protein